MGLVVENVSKKFEHPEVNVLTGINLQVMEGEFVSLTGRSGAGKSTLLYVMSSLDSPTEGKVLIDGVDVNKMDNEDLHRLRNRQIGFVFQFHYLIAELTALQNVLLPAMKFKEDHQRLPRAEALLEQFGLKDKLNRYPRQLSGGEQQRVALARSLIMQPKYLFADEPTGALDTVNAESVLKILKDCSEKQGMAVIMVTHDPDFAAMAHRQVRMADGRIVSEEKQGGPR